ncbi:MAG: RnfABCDGE type electron transport complex subunit D [Ruthenibacterium sp.]
MTAEQPIIVLEKHAAHEMNSDYIWMILPLLAMSLYFYGWRPLVVCAAAMLTANLCDRLVALLRNLPYDKSENSSMAIALLLVMLFPASVPYQIVVISVMVAVLVGKAAFGGYGTYPFNPSALGFAVAAVSWPEAIFRYPVPFSPLPVFANPTEGLVESITHTLRVGGMPNVSLFNLILGNYAGAMGATAALVLVACAMYLWMRKRITLFAPLGFLATCVAIAFFFPRLGGVGLAWPWLHLRLRMTAVMYELLSGALLYAAVFLVSEPVTTPKNEKSRFIYGILLGFATMMFRYYGSYEIGVCFAILGVNAVSGYLDRIVSKYTHTRGVSRLEK